MVAQGQFILQCRLLVLNCFLTRGCFKERYGDIAAKGVSGVTHGIKCVSYVMIGIMSMNQHSKFIDFAYCQYFVFLRQFTSWMKGFFIYYSDNLFLHENDYPNNK